MRGLQRWAWVFTTASLVASAARADEVTPGYPERVLQWAVEPGESCADLATALYGSVEHLERYSRDSKKAHLPAWRRWTKEWSKHSAVGIWHETYVVEPGSYECIYHHMPPFGLGKIGPLVTAEGPRRRAEDRRRLHDINQGKGLAHAAH